MKFSMVVNFLILSFFLTVSFHALAQEDTAVLTIEGLQLVEDTNLARVYAQPGIDLGQYNKVYLQDAYVAFRKNWQQSQNENGTNQISANDMAKIKIELVALFNEVFSRTLEEGGYELVTERAEDVLLIKPAIMNLYIVDPELPSESNAHTYSESAGEMTLYLELYDSLSDDLIARAIDRRIDRETGYFEWQNRVGNRAAANRILQVWADVLKEGLDEARSSR